MKNRRCIVCSGCNSLLSEVQQEVSMGPTSLEGFPRSSSIPGREHMFWPARSITRDSANKTRHRQQTPLRSLTGPPRHLGEQLPRQTPSPVCYLLQWKCRSHNRSKMNLSEIKIFFHCIESTPLLFHVTALAEFHVSWVSYLYVNFNSLNKPHLAYFYLLLAWKIQSYMSVSVIEKIFFI